MHVFSILPADKKRAEAAAAASACIICAGKGGPFPNKGYRRCVPEKHQKKIFHAGPVSRRRGPGSLKPAEGLCPSGDQVYQVGDAGDALPLLGGGGGHQRAGADEQDAFQLPLLHFFQQVGAEDRRRAAAARAARVDILLAAVIDQQPAVGVIGAERIALSFAELAEQVTPHGGQVAGDNQVVVVRLGGGILKEGRQGIRSRGRHRRAHIIGVGDAQVSDPPDGGRRYPDAAAAHADHRRTGGGRRPLGSLRPLPAVLQREAELPLRRAEVGGGERAAQIRRAAVHKDRGEGQGLRHGRAGAELAEHRHPVFPHPEGGGDALVEQVAREQVMELGGGHPRLVHRPGKRLPL